MSRKAAVVEVGGVDEWLVSLTGEPSRRMDKVYRWGPWIMATDGALLAAIPDDGRDAPEPPFGSTRVLEQIRAELPHPQSFRLAALRKWCGPIGEECGECCEGFVPHRTVDRLGTIGGVLFNRRQLRRLLNTPLGESVTLSHHADPMHPISVVGTGWRGLLMPMRTDGDALERARPIEKAHRKPRRATPPTSAAKQMEDER